MATKFTSVTKAAGDTITAAERNALRLDILKNAGDYATSGGSSGAYTLTVDSQITSYVAGDIFKYKANHDNPITNPTINVNVIGALTIKRPGGLALRLRDIRNNQVVEVMYDGTDAILISPIANPDEVVVINAGETVNGETLPVPVYQDTGDSELYACDADDTTKLNYLGFAITNGTNGNPMNLQTGGIVGGFSGLTVGSKYYVSNTAGVLSTTPGTHEILVGIAISASQILIIREDKVCLIDNNATRTLEVTSATPTTGSFTVATPRRAKMIEFDITLMADMQSGSNTTTIKTWKVKMDIINQRIQAKQIYSTTSGNQTSVSLFTSGAANLSELIEADRQSMSGSVLSVSDGGAASVTGITSTENSVAIAYSVNGDGSRKGAIAISTVRVIG